MDLSPASDRITSPRPVTLTPLSLLPPSTPAVTIRLSARTTSSTWVRHHHVHCSLAFHPYGSIWLHPPSGFTSVAPSPLQPSSVLLPSQGVIAVVLLHPLEHLVLLRSLSSLSVLKVGRHSSCGLVHHPADPVQLDFPLDFLFFQPSPGFPSSTSVWTFCICTISISVFDDLFDVISFSFFATRHLVCTLFLSSLCFSSVCPVLSVLCKPPCV